MLLHNLKSFRHNITQTTLSSGAGLCHITVPHFDFSACSLWVRAGSRFDPVNKSGLAHFSEHLLLGKTKKYPQKISRLKDLESGGIYMNGFTEKESTHYLSAQFSDQDFEGLEFLIDGVCNAIFDKEDIENERSVILDEKAQKKADSYAQAWVISDEGLWPDNTLGRSVLGSVDFIKNVAPEDISTFLEQRYTPQNSHFVVISNRKTKEIENHINDLYKPREGLVLTNDSSFAPPSLLTIEQRDIDHVVAVVSYRTTAASNSYEYNVLRLIRACMAGGWSSKLNEVLRTTHGLTYWVGGYVEGLSDTGRLSFDFSTNPQDINSAIKFVLDALEELKEKGLEKNILETYKTAYIADMARSSMTPEDLLGWYGESIISGDRVENLYSYAENILTISSEDIIEVAKKYFKKENLSIALVGPINANDVAID